MTDFVGRKVKLEKTEWEHEVSGQFYKGVSYEVDDPKFLKELSETFPKFRLWTPGTVGTMELNMGRTNVHINGEGVVTKIEKG